MPQGRPVAYLTMRGHDPKTRDLDECMRAMVYICERMCAALPPKEIQVRIPEPSTRPNASRNSTLVRHRWPVIRRSS